MLYSKVVLNLVIICFLKGKSLGEIVIPFNEELITSLRNDANLDLPQDEEYEDLRAELLAYHTALATLSDTASRRSMKSTPCWSLGGICINYKLCEGEKFISEVPGCKDKLMVCCFAWNKFHVRDWSDQGLNNLALPFSRPLEVGGKGVVVVKPKAEKIIKPKHKGKKSKHKAKKQKGEQLPELSHEATNDEEHVLANADTADSNESHEKLILLLKKLKGEKLPEGSHEVKDEEKHVLANADAADANESQEKRVVQFLQQDKKQLTTKEISDNENEKKSILRSLRSRFPFLVVSLETE